MVRTGKKLLLICTAALVTCITAPAFAENSPLSTNLCAGQNQNVGTVSVTDNGTTLWVTYTITAPGWFITETHAHAAASLAGFPLAGGKNPVPGNFAQKATHTPGVTTFTHVFNPKPAGATLLVAAHAVVERFEGDGAGTIVDQQDPIITVIPGPGASGNPADAIPFDFVTPSFYSLGRGGELIAQYNCPLVSAPPLVDLAIWEHSASVPPIETALISVSTDGFTWTDLTSITGSSEAGNTLPPATHGSPPHFTTFFDGGIAGARFVRVRDTSPFDATGNGFDLEAIKSKQACTSTSVEEQTAWGAACAGGGGTRFNARGNWATYITYTVQH